MNAKHTPGPWIWDGREIKAGKDLLQVTGVSIPCGRVDPNDDCFANARLIAAAPDLLAGLTVAMEYLTHVDLEWAKDARAAIAKATQL